MSNNEVISSKIKKRTYGERINIAQTELDEVNLSLIQDSDGSTITEAVQKALQLYSDLIRTHRLKETLSCISKQKAITIENSKCEIEELKAEIERLKSK